MNEFKRKVYVEVFARHAELEAELAKYTHMKRQLEAIGYKYE